MRELEVAGEVYNSYLRLKGSIINVTIEYRWLPIFLHSRTIIRSSYANKKCASHAEDDSDDYVTNSEYICMLQDIRLGMES